MLKKNPVVSIVIPTYNEERNIGRILTSIKNQTAKGVEAIVVDDGSTDKTIAISKKYTKKVYPRKHKERSVQRNFGASKASGKYVLFLDADMELTPNVVKDCLHHIDGFKGLVIPETTVGNSLMSKIRRFEREMYMGDRTIEVARFFEKKVFDEFGGYDINLTGAEDYDLPKRISEKYPIGRSKEYILHHEEIRTLGIQLRKKFYYAKNSALYAQKHPDLISKQGILILRKAYLKNWKKFISHPLLGVYLILVRTLETIAAVSGFIKSVGIIRFLKTFFIMLKYL